VATRRVDVRARAAQDLVEVALYLAIEAGSELLAERFLAATELACSMLLEMPEIGSPCAFLSPRLAGIRRWAVPDFPNHLVFYRVNSNGIEIIRVLHSAMAGADEAGQNFAQDLRRRAPGHEQVPILIEERISCEPEGQRRLDDDSFTRDEEPGCERG
jgi:plasmid stabilization system protein ParE